jgi:hypothetical protein|tara:strand:+ start:1139 stop:2128 length:990 start_codon:yes stop_codon:yes gene_type:complete
MAYKQNFKSPILKALVGKQRNLPQHLQDAIKAAPESPAKMKDLSGDGKVTKKDVLIGRGVLDKDGSPAKLDRNKKGRRDASGKLSVKQDPSKLKGKEKEEFIKNYAEPKKSPAKKNGPGKKNKSIQKGTVNAARQMLKDSTGINNPNLSDADIIKAAKAKGVYGAASSQAKRAAGKGSTNYDYESPAKVKDPVTGKKVKGYAKADRKVSKVRDRQERKDTKKALKATAKSDGKITRLERKGINKSTRDLKTKQQNKRVVEFQKQKTKDVRSKEYQRLRNKAKKLNDAVNVGYDANKADKKFQRAADKADKRIRKAKKVQARTERNVKRA